MESVDVAIMTKIAATSGLASVGDVYFGLQDEHKAIPYLCFSQPGGSQTDYIDAKYLYQPRYSFSIFHTDKAAAGTLQVALQAAFDRTTLIYSGSIASVSCIRVLSIVRAHSQPTKDGELVYQAVSDYIITSDQSF